MGVARVRRVVAGNTVRDAREWMGLSDAEIALATGVHRRTVQRWINSGVAPQPQHAGAMELLRELMHLLRICFVTPDAVQEWLHSPVPLLRGRTPASLIQENRSNEVISILAGLATGAHA